MKKYFITGLVILLPVTLTLLVVGFVFNLLTEPFLGITKAILNYYDLLDRDFFFLSAEQLQTIVSQILIFIVIILFTLGLGAIARWFFIFYIIEFWEYLINRIPLVSSIYKACKDVIKTVFSSDSNAFKQVVLVQFPNAQTHTVALVTQTAMPSMERAIGAECVVVFVPTTPNPTSGFLVIVKKSEVIPLDMTVEEAFKYIISCGVIMAPFKKGEMTEIPTPELTMEEKNV